MCDWTAATELQSLRRALLLLAHGADYVLDLHCDCEAVMHFYTEEPCWPQLEPLTRFLQCQAVLLAKNSGSGPLDECLSGLWWRLADRVAAAGHHAPLPQGCCSTTVELRGEADVAHHKPMQRHCTPGCSTSVPLPHPPRPKCPLRGARPRHWRGRKRCAARSLASSYLPPRSAKHCSRGTWSPK